MSDMGWLGLPFQDIWEFPHSIDLRAAKHTGEAALLKRSPSSALRFLSKLLTLQV